jgi:PAS domain S-box-containing protein
VRLSSLRLRAILALLVLTTLVPLGIFAGWLIFRSWQQQQAIVERRSVETARAVMVAVDQEMESVRSSLQAFAVTEVLDAPDRARFNQTALRLVPTQPGWHAVLLVHPSGAVIADTALPSGDVPSFTTADWVQAVIKTRRWTVSNLIRDESTGEDYFIVAVPVMRGGELRYVLGAQLRADALSRILRRQSAPPNGVVTLLDRGPHIVARTRGEQDYRGRPPSEDFLRQSERMNEGSWRSTLLEGESSYASMSRSPLTGWIIGIGMPAQEVDAPVRRSIVALTLAGIVILTLGLVSALMLSRVVVRALTSAAGAARSLARGEPLALQPSPIVEAEELANGLMESASILDERLQQRDKALAAERIAHALSEQDQARLAVTLRSIGDGVITTDPAGHVNLINPVAQLMTGWDEASAHGRPIDEVFNIVSEGLRQRVENPVRRVFREGRIVGLANHTLLLSRDGREIPIEDSAAPIRASDGGLIGIVLVFRDATERRETERRRLQLLEQEQAARREAEAVSRSKDEFVATVSHELRTPLNAIFGWVRLLRTGKLDEAKREHALEVVERNTRAQAQLIEDLLDMSRVVTGHLRLDMRRVDLASVTRTAVEAVKPSAEGRDISIALDLPPNLGSITGDPDRLQQIIWNLLTNSVKFTPKGGRIRVTLRVEGSDAILQVSDTGVGMSPELLPHVFERFRQGVSSASRTHGGLGIGLALVRHLTQMHGGTVMAASDGENRGATFTVRFPMLGPRAVLDREALSPRDGGALRQDSNHVLAGLNILVVDDDADARDLVTVTLRQAGAQVKPASSAREALESLSTDVPHVLVSDIAMPHGTGYDLVEQIRTTPRWAQLPAIALTAYDRPEDRERSLKAGFDFHVGKPVDPEYLIHVVVSAAGRL